MSLSCETDFDGVDDYEWYWNSDYEYRPLTTKCSRKCCSCKERIEIGSEAMTVHRWHHPQNDIEERIYGDEVPRSNWYLCETCGDLALSLNELKFCYTLGGASLKKQIADYRSDKS